MIVPPRCLTLVRQLNLAATPSRGADRKTGIRFQGPNPLELTELLAAGAEERTRTSTGLPPPDPESGVSTNSTTSARRRQSGRHVLDAMMQVKAIPGNLPALVGAGVGYEKGCAECQNRSRPSEGSSSSTTKRVFATALPIS